MIAVVVASIKNKIIMFCLIGSTARRSCVWLLWLFFFFFITTNGLLLMRKISNTHTVRPRTCSTRCARRFPRNGPSNSFVDLSCGGAGRRTDLRLLFVVVSGRKRRNVTAISIGSHCNCTGRYRARKTGDYRESSESEVNEQLCK